jgi:hypothetical protein
VRYVRLNPDDKGESRFEAVVVQGHSQHVVDGLPPLLLTGPYSVTNIVFVEQPSEASDWNYPSPLDGSG